MKNVFAVLTLSLLAACSGPDARTPVDEPGALGESQVAMYEAHKGDVDPAFDTAMRDFLMNNAVKGSVTIEVISKRYDAMNVVQDESKVTRTYPCDDHPALCAAPVLAEKPSSLAANTKSYCSGVGATSRYSNEGVVRTVNFKGDVNGKTYSFSGVTDGWDPCDPFPVIYLIGDLDTRLDVGPIE